ncbi:hypothetical protein C0584_04365 [Candidatus Parcubacteria bacterium]|nr:MAG: hypothetical protein C0584_04365 [Candidatus Parcubacteria bacterium]
MFKAIKNFVYKNEKYLSPGAITFGFIFDNLTLRRIDLWVENFVIAFYLALSLFSIFVLNFFHAGYLKHRYFRKTDAFLSIVLQFSFGALFSAFFIFYFRSSSIIASWSFLVLLIGLLIGNEFFRDKYKQLSFQLSIYFILFFSYSVFLVPLVTKKIDDFSFIYSNVFSISFILSILLILYKLFPKRLLLNIRSITVSIFFIIFTFNFFYYFNIIPPIPLSLKSAELVHSVKHNGGIYEIEYEKSIFPLGSKSKKRYSWVEGEPVYLFASIFAPTKISVEIFHKWYFFDETNSEWTLRSSIPYQVIGGRDGGYRGYSYKYSLQEGLWMVDITNTRGQSLGSRKFRIVAVEDTPDLTKEEW